LTGGKGELVLQLDVLIAEDPFNAAVKKREREGKDPVLIKGHRTAGLPLFWSRKEGEREERKILASLKEEMRKGSCSSTDPSGSVSLREKKRGGNTPGYSSRIFLTKGKKKGHIYFLGRREGKTGLTVARRRPRPPGLEKKKKGKEEEREKRALRR